MNEKFRVESSKSYSVHTLDWNIVIMKHCNIEQFDNSSVKQWSQLRQIDHLSQ